MRRLVVLVLALAPLAGRPAAGQERIAAVVARPWRESVVPQSGGECRGVTGDGGVQLVQCGMGSFGVGRTLATAGPQVPGPEVRASVWAIAASAALPGAGQAMLGVDRFLPYLAAEAYLWMQYAAHARDSRRERNAYRALAASVARGGAPGSLPNGDFEYYERMKHYAESGRFSLRSDGVLEPETDTTTYNGAVWLLARRTYWSDIAASPDTASREWRLAEEFYRRRGYDTPFLWSWGGAPLEYGEFRRLIERSNESNRKALQNVGVIIANHLLSTVDALVTVRLRRRPATASVGEGWAVEGSMPLAGFRLAGLRR